MCGIVGVYNGAEPVNPMLIQAMTNVIAHRGPDSGGAFIDGNVGLGIRRLSVIDLVSGDQPIANEDGTCHIVFNGEIYNYREIRERLLARGHRFRTNSDTEVILHLYEDRGVDCVQELRGMFAFAVFDQRNRRLFVARDRMGIKPLYYVNRRGALVFGSEIKSLLQWDELRPEMDLAALSDYLLLGYVPAPRTLFEGVRKLPAGHWLAFDGERVEERQYWDIPAPSASDGRKRSEESYLEEFEALLRDAVRMRLIADVPLGAFLSGGLDSSVIVALMDDLGGGSVKTFSVGFEGASDSDYDERSFARIASEHCRTDHHELVMRPRMIDLLPKIAWHLDEPVADPATVPTFLVSELAARHVTVVLSGEGADELLGGYQRYRVEPVAQRIGRLTGHRLDPRSLRILGVLPGPLGKLGQALALKSPAERLAFWNAHVSPSIRSRLLSDDALAAMAHEDYRSEAIVAAFAKASDPAQAHLFADQKVWLADDLLVKADKMSMAHSLEARLPFLDHKVVEFAAAVPFNLKLRGATTKYLLRRLARKLLPATIWQRKKHGFNVPLREWFVDGRNDEMGAILANLESRRGHLFRHGAVAQLAREHREGRADHSRALWNLMNLECWFESYLDRPAPTYSNSSPQLVGMGCGTIDETGGIAQAGVQSRVFAAREEVRDTQPRHKYREC